MNSPDARKAAQRYLCENRRARRDYEILETYTAGLVLQGWEAKSARQGRVQLGESYVSVVRGELFLRNSHFSPLSFVSTHFTPDPMRPRKLLMTAQEIRRLSGRAREAGLTVTPLNMHLSRGKIKLVIGLARGKKQHDKRRAVQERDWRRQQQRMLKSGRKKR
ncbi:MAG: SsrA-binding protein SmpB [Gammaproteobacteria bacterium]